ncbi:MAG: hypothetical protein HFJ50_09005 [Clostridia bacterium]|jgi:hypothetical protein|nr:hypothetical protein [Clostridia bacterium]
MENLADALKFGFAVVVFAIALTLLFQTVGLAKNTADTLISEADSTTYYTYIPAPGDETISRDPNNHNVATRIVTMQDIIPTLYRYSVESYGVTIIDKDGEIVTRFDTDTEQICNVLDSSAVNLERKQRLIDEIDMYVLRPVGAIPIENIDNLRELFEKIYKQNKSNTNPRTYECPWAGNQYKQWVAQRIDSDLSGHTAYFDLTNLGTQSTNTNSKNHVSCVNEGLINKYMNNTKITKFREYLILHDKNNPELDEGNAFYTQPDGGQLPDTIKREIIYVEIDD